MNSSVAFSTFTMLCNHHLNQVPKHFAHPKEKTVFILSSPQLPTTTSLSSVSIGLLILDSLY